jgi:predicted dehydrogenase
MKIEEARAVVFGAGSIGERHINNLLTLGCNDILVYRQRNLPLRNVESAKVKIFTDLDDIAKLHPTVAFVTSPTAQHLSQTELCVSLGIPVLVEKPLSHTLEGLEKLKRLVHEKHSLVQVGYMMRFHPLLQKVKRAIEDQTWGKLIYFRSYWGEYLPAWHPWEDYRTSYAARKELGGGAALTLSHDLDLANWLTGAPVKSYHTTFNNRSSLEVNVESGADINLQYENGVTGHVHLNFFQKVPRREYQFEFDQASVLIDFYKAELTIRTENDTEVIKAEAFDRNNLFLDQTRAFFNLTHLKDPTLHAIQQIEESALIISICQDER